MLSVVKWLLERDGIAYEGSKRKAFCWIKGDPEYPLHNLTYLQLHEFGYPVLGGEQPTKAHAYRQTAAPKDTAHTNAWTNDKPPKEHKTPTPPALTAHWRCRCSSWRFVEYGRFLTLPKLTYVAQCQEQGCAINTDRFWDGRIVHPALFLTCINLS